MRGTGRTIRMIEEAVKLAKEGRAVYVVVGHWMLGIAKQMVRERTPDGLTGGEWPKVESPATLGRGWNSKLMTTPGAHKNSVFWCDHYLIEQEYAEVLHMLHRFDLPQNSRA